MKIRLNFKYILKPQKINQEIKEDIMWHCAKVYNTFNYELQKGKEEIHKKRNRNIESSRIYKRYREENWHSKYLHAHTLQEVLLDVLADHKSYIALTEKYEREDKQIKGKPSSVYDTINYNDTASYGYSTYTKDRVVANVQATSKKGFPKARKLKVQILDLRYYEMIPEEKKSKSEPISNAIWNLEIEVPEQFYQRSNIEYILEKPIAGIQLEKAIVSETSMAFIATIDGFDEVIERKYDDTTQRIKQSLSVIDENGKQYFPEANFGCSKDRIETNFSINKDIVTEKLYLKVAIQEKIHTLTLIRKCKI